ncbi:unnamed protein product, partial [Mesorhabditis spiculigera]
MFPRPSLAQLLVPNFGNSAGNSETAEPISLATTTNNEEPNDEDSDESLLGSRLIRIPREQFRKWFKSSRKATEPFRFVSSRRPLRCNQIKPNIRYSRRHMAGRAKDAGVRTVLRLRQKPPLCFLIVNRAYHEYGLKHLVLIGVFIFYVLFGAFILLIIESPAQTDMKQNWMSEIRKNRSYLVDSMMKEVFNNSEYLIYIKGNTTDKLRVRFDRIFEVYETRLGIRWSEQRMEWDYWNAILFAGTIITTIGYGHIYPMTDPGRVITMVYALVGIPLMLLVLQDVGKILTIAMKYPWFQFKRIGRRILKCCTKQSLREMRRIEAEERRDLEVFDLPVPVGVALIFIWVINLLQSKMRTTYEAGGKDVVEIVERQQDATTLGVLQVFQEKESHYLVIPDEMQTSVQSSTHSRQTQTSLSLPGMRQCVLRSDGVHWVDDNSPMKSPDEVTKLVEMESSLHVCQDIGENNRDAEDFDDSMGSSLSFHHRDGGRGAPSRRDSAGTAHHSPSAPNGLILDLSHDDLRARLVRSPEMQRMAQQETLDSLCEVAQCFSPDPSLE